MKAYYSRVSFVYVLSENFQNFINIIKV